MPFNVTVFLQLFAWGHGIPHSINLCGWRFIQAWRIHASSHICLETGFGRWDSWLILLNVQNTITFSLGLLYQWKGCFVRSHGTFEYNILHETESLWNLYLLILFFKKYSFFLNETITTCIDTGFKRCWASLLQKVWDMRNNTCWSSRGQDVRMITRIHLKWQQKILSPSGGSRWIQLVCW